MNNKKLSALFLTAFIAVGVFTGCHSQPSEVEGTQTTVSEQTTKNSEVAEQRYEWSINDIKDNFYIDGEKVEFPISTEKLAEKGLTVDEKWFISSYNDEGNNDYSSPLLYQNIQIGTLSVKANSKEKRIKSNCATMILFCPGYEEPAPEISVCGISLGMSKGELGKFSFADCELAADEKMYKWENDDILVMIGLSDVAINKNSVDKIYVEIKGVNDGE